MNSRERILAVINRQPADRVPVDIWHTDEVLESLMKHFNETDNLSLYKKMGLDKIVGMHIPYKGKEAPGESEEDLVTLWGAHLKPMKVGDATYLECADRPLSGCLTPKDVEDYPWWPDPDGFDYEKALKKAREAAADFITLGPWVSFFEIYCGLRGLEQALMDLLLYPDMVQAALDRIEFVQTEMIRRFYNMASDFIDCAFLSDDMGGQKSLLISLEAWDTFIKPRITRWCSMFHEYGIKVFYHSDGAIEPLIPRLIEAGIDILNPIQHVCPGMDLAHLKKTYGNRLIFHGAMETQRIMPFGSPEDVRRETRRCLEILGAGGQGYICCSCHNLQPGTPVENILAMIETVHQSGAIPSSFSSE